MTQRSKLLTAALVVSTAALFGCPTPAPVQDSGTQDSGCTGVCNGNDAGHDAGTDSGVQDAGPPACGDGGVYLTIGQVRQYLAGTCIGPSNNGVVVQNAVVTSIWDEFTAHAKGIPNDAGTRAFFWVEDPNDTTQGLWVEKFTTDYAADSTANTDYMYNPTPGDNISLNGYTIVRQSASFSSYQAAGRDMFADQFAINGGTGALFITVNSQGNPPADNAVAAGFGDSNDGTVPANSNYNGSRVHIPGPLVVTSGAPAELTRYTSNSFPPAPAGFNGFMVGSPSGGTTYQRILVNDKNLYQTYHSVTIPDGGADGGPIKISVPDPGRCDYGDWARDGGSVTFPNGINGIWDTYAAQPCSAALDPDSGSSFCPEKIPEVELPDGGFNRIPGYVNILWPLDCNDADGGMN